MDPEIIKTATELAKATGTAAGLSIPFTGIVKRMLGPAADELAEMWRDQVRLYRYERQLKCVQKAEKMAKHAGFTPQAVPPKILFPLLEGASLEDDENLHNMWAALLANAARPKPLGIRPGFIATLQQMAPDEAAILKWMHEQTWSPEGSTTFSQQTLAEAYERLGFFRSITIDSDDPRENLKGGLQLGACLDSLESAALIHSQGEYERRLYRLTTRGDQFLYGCRPPKPRENG